MAKISISDRDEYAKYEAGFMDIFMKYQGKLLCVDDEPTVLEGAWACTRTVLVEFPDEQATLDWFNSEEYQTLAKHRHASSTGNIVMINSLG